MSKIIINIHHDGTATVDLSKSESISDRDVCAILLGAYTTTAEEIIGSHECTDQDCCVKTYNQEMLDAIKSTGKIHKLNHRHQ